MKARPKLQKFKPTFNKSYISLFGSSEVDFLTDFSVKLFKEEVTRLLNCKYFSCLPPPPNKSPEVLLKSNGHSSKMIMLTFTVTKHLWVKRENLFKRII